MSNQAQPAEPQRRPGRPVEEAFRTLAHRTAELLGRPAAFAAAVALVAVWALTGPLFDFSSTWQLVINTGTTIVTFLMVFLVQNTQNRDSRSLHLKLDELLRATAGARTAMADLDTLSDEDLAHLELAFKRLAHATAHRRAAAADTKPRP